MGARYARVGRDGMNRTIREIQPPSDTSYDFYNRRRGADIYRPTSSQVGHFDGEVPPTLVYQNAVHGYTGMPLERKLQKVPPVELYAQNFPTNESLYDDHRRLQKPMVRAPFAVYNDHMTMGPLNHRSMVRTSSASALLTAAENFLKIQNTTIAGVGTPVPTEVLKLNRSNLWTL